LNTLIFKLQEWLNIFQEKQKLFFHLQASRSNKTTARENVLKFALRCQHHTRSEKATKKNCQCPATMTITVKKPEFTVCILGKRA
jgi:hypothetical protein